LGLALVPINSAPADKAFPLVIPEQPWTFESSNHSLLKLSECPGIPPVAPVLVGSIGSRDAQSKANNQEEKRSEIPEVT